MVAVNALAFVVFVALVVFGAARLGWAMLSPWIARNQEQIDRLVCDALDRTEES